MNDVPDGTGGYADTSATRPKGFDFTPADQGQLREDQPEARPPRDRVRAEVLLLDVRPLRAGATYGQLRGGEPDGSPPRVFLRGLRSTQPSTAPARGAACYNRERYSA